MSRQDLPVVEFHLRLRRRHLVALGAVAVVAPALLFASSVSYSGADPVAPSANLNGFSNGTVANAAQVNDNFVQLKVAVNDNDARINALLAAPTWTNMTLLNGWQHQGGAYGNAQYSKDATGRVCLRGLVVNGSSATAVVTTLPVGFRPARSLEFSAGISGTVPGELIVLSTGNTYFESGSTAWSSFDGICFHTN